MTATNELVAKHIFAWECVEDPKEIAHRDGRKWDLDPGWHQGPAWYHEGQRMACKQCGDMPDFLGSIESAWRVVEKMREDGYAFSVGARPDAFEAELCDEGGMCWTVDDADTAPHAICLAALRAKGVDL